MDLVALEEIRQVKYRYLRCVDLKLWDEMAGVFTVSRRRRRPCVRADDEQAAR